MLNTGGLTNLTYTPIVTALVSEVKVTFDLANKTTSGTIGPPPTAGLEFTFTTGNAPDQVFIKQMQVVVTPGDSWPKCSRQRDRHSARTGIIGPSGHWDDWLPGVPPPFQAKFDRLKERHHTHRRLRFSQADRNPPTRELRIAQFRLVVRVLRNDEYAINRTASEVSRPLLPSFFFDTTRAAPYAQITVFSKRR